MEIEEAGEIILRNDPFQPCPCGDGTRFIREDEVSDRFLPPNLTRCENCGGQGQVVKTEYLEAAQLLGLPLPILVRTPAAKKVWLARQANKHAAFFESFGGRPQSLRTKP